MPTKPVDRETSITVSDAWRAASRLRAMGLRFDPPAAGYAFLAWDGHVEVRIGAPRRDCAIAVTVRGEAQAVTRIVRALRAAQ